MPVQGGWDGGGGLQIKHTLVQGRCNQIDTYFKACPGKGGGGGGGVYGVCR